MDITDDDARDYLAEATYATKLLNVTGKMCAAWLRTNANTRAAGRAVCSRSTYIDSSPYITEGDVQSYSPGRSFRVEIHLQKKGSV